MKYSIAFINIITAILLFPVFSQAQIKFERETKIDRENVPSEAIAFIDSCFIRKVKWYLEESHEGKSIEAKAKLGGDLYSIEFDTMGKIQDVEKKVKFGQIPSSVKKKIKQDLSKNFKKFKIKKSQIQWRATNQTLQLLVKTGEADENFSLHYELIIKGKIEGPSKYYEVLFDQTGSIERTLEIVERPTTNLDF